MRLQYYILLCLALSSAIVLAKYEEDADVEEEVIILSNCLESGHSNLCSYARL